MKDGPTVMTKETMNALVRCSTKQLAEDQWAYREALPRYTVTTGKYTFQTDRSDLAQWEASALNASMTDRHDLKGTVTRFANA